MNASCRFCASRLRRLIRDQQAVPTCGRGLGVWKFERLELRRDFFLKTCVKRDLNPRPPRCKRDALPLSYSRVFREGKITWFCRASTKTCRTMSSTMEAATLRRMQPDRAGLLSLRQQHSQVIAVPISPSTKSTCVNGFLWEVTENRPRNEIGLPQLHLRNERFRKQKGVLLPSCSRHAWRNSRPQQRPIQNNPLPLGMHFAPID